MTVAIDIGKTMRHFHDNGNPSASYWASGSALLDSRMRGNDAFCFAFGRECLSLDSRMRGNHSWRWRATPNDENLFSEQ
ncbi:MAG: hypothetical protein AAFY26_03830 [Cyanobacteria bacterium J06638_22]